VTLLDALRERSHENDPRRAIDALVAAMPVGRAVEITPEVIEAAETGNIALLVSLFAEEDEPEPDELEMLADAARLDDGSRATVAEVRRELGLSL